MHACMRGARAKRLGRRRLLPAARRRAGGRRGAPGALMGAAASARGSFSYAQPAHVGPTFAEPTDADGPSSARAGAPRRPLPGGGPPDGLLQPALWLLAAPVAGRALVRWGTRGRGGGGGGRFNRAPWARPVAGDRAQTRHLVPASSYARQGPLRRHRTAAARPPRRVRLPGAQRGPSGSRSATSAAASPAQPSGRGEAGCQLGCQLRGLGAGTRWGYTCIELPSPRTFWPRPRPRQYMALQQRRASGPPS